jgi:hypothetical protein
MEERIIAADPVADPEGYREQAGGLPGELVGRPPRPGEWSVAELLASFTALRASNLRR